MINLIEETDISSATLSIELERAVIQHESKPDGSLYVFEDGFPFWVRVLKKSGFVAFATYIGFRESSTQLEKLTLANSFNKTSFMISAYVVKEELRIDHAISYRDGMLKETFIRGCRNFSSVVEKAINDLDPEYKVIMRLSELSSEGRDENRVA